MPQLHEMSSLCIHGAEELGTDQTAAHLILYSRAGGTWGKGDLQCHGSEWWIWRSKRESVNSAEVWKLPKTRNEHCFLPASFWRKQIRGWPAGTISIAVAGLCQSADLSKDFSHVHHSVGGSLLAGKGQAPRGNIKLSMVTWMRLGKANQADAQWSWALFKLRQFIPNAWRKNVNEDRSNMFGYSWYRKLPHTSDLSWSIHYLFNNWFQFLTNKEVQ